MGQEDRLCLQRGKLATSNARQVSKIDRILTELGMAIATPAETRAMAKLKGAGSVAFAC